MKILHTFTIGILVAMLGCESDATKRDRFFQTGLRALETGAHEEAIRSFSNSLQMDPEYKEAYNNRGVAFFRDGKVHEAIQDYNQALILDNEYFECLHNRAQAYEAIGRYPQSLDDYDRLISAFPDSSFGYFGKALVRTRMNEFDDAYALFDIVLELDTGNLEARTNQATLRFYMGQYQRAIRQIYEVLQKRKMPDAYNTLNQVYLAIGDHQKALEAVENALALAPAQPYYLNNRGFTYLQMDSLERGLQDINQSILLDPGNMWAMRNKGIYFLKKKEPKKAEGYFGQVVRSRSAVENAYYYLGQSYYDQGLIKEACDNWKKGSVKGETLSETKLKENCQ